jgi:hypothetical protein
MRGFLCTEVPERYGRGSSPAAVGLGFARPPPWGFFANWDTTRLWVGMTSADIARGWRPDASGRHPNTGNISVTASNPWSVLAS